MPRTTPPILPPLQRELASLGERLRHARLRRAHAAETIAQRAGVTRKTLGRVERGDPAVSLGVYVRVLQALGLDADLAHIARDDELGRRLQDQGLKQPRRALRKKEGSMERISSDEGEAYLARWRLVQEAEVAELRRTSMETKLRQLAALVAARDTFGPDADRDLHVAEVRERWNRLRQTLGG